jgi:hypothetical protein
MQGDEQGNRELGACATPVLFDVPLNQDKLGIGLRELGTGQDKTERSNVEKEMLTFGLS